MTALSNQQLCMDLDPGSDVYPLGRRLKLEIVKLAEEHVEEKGFKSTKVSKTTKKGKKA
ncbi:conserved hypothetical protein [Ricinus communis]|uniref:Uncharacterized protein n=1 Tax=Ricinus communis TaxID=3988 RepID=B9SVT8_RICCO|nr:conserved hypothetical protein [Ricinus communis]